MIGDTVNVAARIEELAGQLEATLIVSEELLAAARVTPDGEAWRPLLNMALRGRQKPINIYMINETAGPTTGLAPKSRQAANSVYARSTRGMLRDATSHEQAMRS